MHLRGKLEKQGFKQSSIDPCLFIHPKMVCVVYVGDCIFAGPFVNDIYSMLDDLRKDNLSLHVESDVAGFLGVDIHPHGDGSIELPQVGLIDRIIAALHLDYAIYLKKMPAAFGALPKDANGESPEMLFSYRSVVGMLAYLSQHCVRIWSTLCPYACASFTILPSCTKKRLSALVFISRSSLKGTRTRVIIIEPDGSMNVDMYCNADFARLWGYEERTDPSCVKSFGGYTIFVGGCPVLWGSKLIN